MKTAALLAPLLEGFFTKRLLAQRRASPHTIASYRDSFRLLLKYAEKRLGRAPSELKLDDLHAPFVASFLDELEGRRGNGARTRNIRLAAIYSFFRYAALEVPEHSALIQRVLAIPRKRSTRALIDFLVRPEIEALLAKPDQTTWVGRRDHAFSRSAQGVQHRDEGERLFRHRRGHPFLPAGRRDRSKLRHCPRQFRPCAQHCRRVGAGSGEHDESVAIAGSRQRSGKIFH